MLTNNCNQKPVYTQNLSLAHKKCCSYTLLYPLTLKIQKEKEYCFLYGTTDHRKKKPKSLLAVQLLSKFSRVCGDYSKGFSHGNSVVVHTIL